jgi:ribulose-phosphate 3-epimerase
MKEEKMDIIEGLPGNRLLAEFSLWSANLVRMKDDMARVEPYVDIYHADVADGHFSPALLLFPDLLGQIRAQTRKPIHVHLMVSDAILLDQIDQFADAGADILSVHAENANAESGLERVLSKGAKAGIVLQLHTPVETVAPLLDRISMLTLLGTRIGIKGVGLDPSAEDRLATARRLVDRVAGERRVLLAADGGIREHTVPGLRRSGADTIVMGSLAFGDSNLASRMAWVHALPEHF